MQIQIPDFIGYETRAEYDAMMEEADRLCEEGCKEKAVVKELQQQLKDIARRTNKGNLWVLMRISTGEKRREILRQIETQEAEWTRLSAPIYEQLERMKPLFIEGQTFLNSSQSPNPFWKNRKWEQGYRQTRELFAHLLGLVLKKYDLL